MYFILNYFQPFKRSHWNEIIVESENIWNVYGVNVHIATLNFLNFQTFIPAKNNGLEVELHGASVALNFAPTMQCTLLKMEGKLTLSPQFYNNV